MGDDRRLTTVKYRGGYYGRPRAAHHLELYKVYSAYHNEPFDKFYFWGDMPSRTSIPSTNT